MKRALGLALLLIAHALGAQSQTQPERYKEILFDSLVVTKDVRYGPLPVHLLDFYAPQASDGERARPLVVYIHGGGFKNQTKIGSFQTRVCTTLAKRGYVAASIEYRLTKDIPDTTAYMEAMMRGLQDAKAAVRYFRLNAKMYHIDPNRIYATVSSAGSIIALHMAYLDSANVPLWIRWENVGGSFEGSSGNPGASSDIQAVINCWGAIGDTSWMTGKKVPVYSVHGQTDTTVFYERVPSYKCFKYGSKHISAAAQRLGLAFGDHIFPNTGHTLDNDAAKQFEAIEEFSKWLYHVQKQQVK